MKKFMKLITLVVLFSMVVGCGGTTATTAAPPEPPDQVTEAPATEVSSPLQSNGRRTMELAHIHL